jgi:tungstate transport system ATP-binding protein
MVSSLFPLALHEVSVRRKGRTILGPVTYQLGAGGVTVLLGPNGSGKTTFLRSIHGIERLSGGAVKWAVDPKTAQERQAYVFQTPIMLRRSVADNLRYPLTLAHTPRPQVEALVSKWLDQTGLAALAQTQATRLSGGERQKLALARALVRAPEVLFLDEPCANLDGQSTREIEVLLAEARKDGTAIIMATHDLGQARRLATDIIFMLSGRVHEHGPARQLLSQPETPELESFLRGDIVI